jgi:hypothetical protein
MEERIVSDEQLIAEVARIWVDAGGDEEGLMWNVQRIRDAIAAEIAARKEDEGLQMQSGETAA